MKKAKDETYLKQDVSKKKDVAYQNKDIASKTFAELFPKESFEVYGIHLPRIVRVLPTDLPAISANELRIDHIFELEDGSFAIIDYESTYKKRHKIKYLQYIIRILKRYKDSDAIKIRMIVLYTADVLPQETESSFDAGAIHLEIEQAFLSELDSDEMQERLTRKIRNKEALTQKELMEFVILPLTYQGIQAKRESIKTLFSTAKELEDENIQTFLLTGIMVFSDKVIDQKIANQMKEWIMMTKVEKLFEKEKLEAVKKAKEEVTKEVTKEVTEEVTKEVATANAKAFLKEGVSVEMVAKCVNILTLSEVKELARSLEK